MNPRLPDGEESPALERDIFWDQTEPVLEDFPPWSEAYLSNIYQSQNNTYDTPEGREDYDFKTVQELRDPMAWVRLNKHYKRFFPVHNPSSLTKYLLE